MKNSEIRELQRAAGEAGDFVQVAICSVALDREWDEKLPDDDTLRICVRRALERRGIVPEHHDADLRARVACEAENVTA